MLIETDGRVVNTVVARGSSRRASWADTRQTQTSVRQKTARRHALFLHATILSVYISGTGSNAIIFSAINAGDRSASEMSAKAHEPCVHM